MYKKLLRKISAHKFKLLGIVSSILLIISVSILATGEKEDPISNIATNLHLNIWDWLALIVAFMSFIVSSMTWYSQNETMKNTAIIGKEELQDKLAGSYHSLIRNVVNLYSLYIKLDQDEWKSYPSEEYMWKIKLTEFDENSISVRLVYGDRFYKIQNLNELIRFFNMHVDAAILHLKNGAIELDVKKRDLTGLNAMIWLIANHLSLTMVNLFPSDNGSENYAKIRTNIKECINQWYNGIDKATASIPLDNYKSMFSDIENHPFVKSLYKDRSDDKADFIMKISSVIAFHLSKRPDGYDRIPLIGL